MKRLLIYKHLIVHLEIMNCNSTTVYVCGRASFHVVAIRLIED